MFDHKVILAEAAPIATRPDSKLSLGDALFAMVAIFFAVAACAFIGFLSRPSDSSLATIWLSNPVLLSIFLRFPQYNKWYLWLVAVASYTATDLLAGDTLAKSVLLTISNFSGIAMGVFLYSFFPFQDRILFRPQSIVFYFVTSLCVGVVAGLSGMVIMPQVFPHVSPLEGFLSWFTGELVNYMVVLPVFLSIRFPENVLRFRRKKLFIQKFDLMQWMPAVALLLSLIFTNWISGPASIAFSVPALLWCAVSYPMPATAALTAIYSYVMLLTRNTAPYFDDQDAVRLGLHSEVVSLRIGIALITLAPILVCGIMSMRNALVDRLEYYASHDFLTGTLNRSGLQKMYQRYMKTYPSVAATLLVLDLDFFKKINDTYGHEAGDIVLQQVSTIIAGGLRQRDLLARLGGEEFAVVLANCSHKESVHIAERLCALVRETAIPIDKDTELNITVTIGGVSVARPIANLDFLIKEADELLYVLKKAGRNRAEVKVLPVEKEDQIRSLPNVHSTREMPHPGFSYHRL